MLLAGIVKFSAVLTECNVRGNSLDSESAHTLAKVATEKRIMLFGIKHNQTEANFRNNGLGAVDAVLISNDISVSRSLSKVIRHRFKYASAFLSSSSARTRSTSLQQRNDISVCI